MSRGDGFLAATASYERWRADRIPVVSEDLETKHEKLASSPFVLLRGTYYREFSPELRRRVAGVGSLGSRRGAEAANIHLSPYQGTAPPKTLRKDDDARRASWLADAARTMAELTERDHADWLARRPRAEEAASARQRPRRPSRLT
jgi:hypothetical protein